MYVAGAFQVSLKEISGQVGCHDVTAQGDSEADGLSLDLKEKGLLLLLLLCLCSACDLMHNRGVTLVIIFVMRRSKMLARLRGRTAGTGRRAAAAAVSRL